MSRRDAYSTLNRHVRHRANFVRRTADIPNAKLREVARCAAGSNGIANLQMLEITLLDSCAGRVQFAVQEQPEAPSLVARESDMRPGIRHDWLRGDDNVVNRASDPNAKAVVVEIGIERARSREDRVLVANAGIQLHPALDREWT